MSAFCGSLASSARFYGSNVQPWPVLSDHPPLPRMHRYCEYVDGYLSFDNFLAGARRFASLAMTARARLDHDLFALHAGVAVERLAKAVLASKNPALLLDLKGGNRSTEMLFHLTGTRDIGAEKVWTIGAADAISRLQGLEVLSPDRMLKRLIELRNGVAHSIGEDVAEEDLLPVFARTIDVLLRHADVSLGDFWGSWLPAAAAAVSGTQTSQNVQLRIKHAKDLYTDRVSVEPGEGMGPAEGEDKYAFVLVIDEDRVEITKRVGCPACEQSARVQMIAHVDTITDDQALFTINQFSCGHCPLRLAGQAELEAAGLESEFELNLNERPQGDERAVLVDKVQDYIEHRERYVEQIRKLGEHQEWAFQLVAKPETE